MITFISGYFLGVATVVVLLIVGAISDYCGMHKLVSGKRCPERSDATDDGSTSLSNVRKRHKNSNENYEQH